MAFRVGQKIECINNSARSAGGFRFAERPVLGGVYTVTHCFIGPAGRPSVLLAEIRRDTPSRARHGDGVGYGEWRFRPIVERKTDISIFEKMLTGGKQPVRVS